MSVDYFKDAPSLTAVPPNPERHFILSHMTPFGGRLITEVLGCADANPTANPDYHVQYYPEQYGYNPNNAPHKFIRLASARLLAKHGAQLIIVDIDATKCQAAAESIGNGAVWKTCDVSDWYQQVDLFQWIVSQFGALDVVMGNAGIDPELASSLPDGHPSREKARCKVFYDFSQDEMEEGPGGKGHMLKAPSRTILDVNVKGPLYNLKLATHHMKALGKGGRIIFVGSANSYLPIPDQTVYVTSKHAVLGMMRAASRRQDCKDAGITICLLAPWTTVTPLTAEILETIPDEQIEKSSPDDLAWAVGLRKAIWLELDGESIQIQREARLVGKARVFVMKFGACLKLFCLVP
ncbi:hypothetical protein LTS18_004578 [Coniosporium uncinatum]|uniref:Uncharacterized protein n=1 Tax=Coniosporium uncinatum TaxID=93489 RepID=A0ACC3DSD6_9PEZI|nr:hypothetical protein LTS18_004578 [Coniosporium uncinatum]